MKKIFPLIVCIALTISGCQSKPSNHFSVAKKGVNAAAISQDNRYALVASTNHEVGVWDLSKKTLLYAWKHKQNQKPNIVAVTISGNSRFALTAEKRTIVWWNLKTGKSLGYFTVKADIQAAALSYDGKHALLGQNNAKAIYLDLTTGQKLKELGQFETINSVALSNDGRFALTGGDDKLAILWDLKNTKALHQWQHKKRVHFVTFSPDSKYALTAAPQAEVDIWSTANGQRIDRMEHKSLSISDAKFSSNASFFALGVIPNKLQLRRVGNPKVISAWRIPKKSAWKPTSAFIYAITFINDQRLMTIDSRGDVMWWDKS